MIDRLLAWVLRDRLDSIHQQLDVQTGFIADLRSDLDETLGEAEAAKRVARQTLQQLDDLRDRVVALQAVDVDFHDGGKVILVARVGDKDVVKIFNTRPKMSLADYRDFCKLIEYRYGARTAWADAPPPYGDYLKDTL